jgi:hypothetical protein
MADIPVEKTVETTLPPVGQTKVEVNQGNVPIVLVQLLNDINIKLGKILERMGENA